MSATNHETATQTTDDSNGGRANCILGVCCPSMEARVAALAADMARDLGYTEGEARECAAYMLKHYDLAPPRTLAPLYKEIARLAREGYTPNA